MSVLAAVTALLTAHRTRFALIGAAAMAVHGVSRATSDLDLLVVNVECLQTSYWKSSELGGADVAIHAGDVDDPLAGVIRIRESEASQPLDLVVGRGPWVPAVLQRAREAEIEGVRLPVATPSDLILLKLYAGGSQDAWDIEQLLAAGDSAAIGAAVERELPALPTEARHLWRRIRG